MAGCQSCQEASSQLELTSISQNWCPRMSHLWPCLQQMVYCHSASPTGAEFWLASFIVLIGQLYIVPLQLKCGVVWFWHFCRENDNETKKHCINIICCVIKRTNFTCIYFAMPTPKPMFKVLSYKNNISSVAISPGLLITSSDNTNKKIFASKMFGLFRHAWQFGHVTKV